MSKLAWIVVFATFSAAPAAAQGAIPDMRGTWKGDSESIILGAGNPHHAAPPSTEPRLNSVAFLGGVLPYDRAGIPAVAGLPTIGFRRARPGYDFWRERKDQNAPKCDGDHSARPGGMKCSRV
jgi:hypothetical protein